MSEGKVAVVGAGKRFLCVPRVLRLKIKGISDLVTSKSLLEEGFDVKCFDSRNSISGLWKFSNDNFTTVLRSMFKGI
jgi:hypothetical protein